MLIKNTVVKLIKQLLFSIFDLNGPFECAFTVNGSKRKKHVFLR
jgi:hypothetical protein